MSQSEIERRIMQHDNDIESIYELLSDIDRTVRAHDQRFDGIDQQLGGINQQLDTLGKGLAEVLTVLTERS